MFRVISPGCNAATCVALSLLAAFGKLKKDVVIGNPLTGLMAGIGFVAPVAFA